MKEREEEMGRIENGGINEGLQCHLLKVAQQTHETYGKVRWSS